MFLMWKDETSKGKGNIPLHKFLLRDNTPSEIIQALIDNDIFDGIKATNNDENLPIHIACLNARDIDTLTILIKAYPESLQVQNKNKYLPLHAAICNELHGKID